MQTRFYIIAGVCVLALAVAAVGVYIAFGRSHHAPPVSPATLPVSAAPEAPATAEQEHPTLTVAVVMSGSESDPWASELVNTLGNALQIEPWSKRGASGHLDVFGPYECLTAHPPFNCWIALSGLAGVVGYQDQGALGSEAVRWVKSVKPDVVWLDGDQAQMQIGTRLDPKLPIVFSGVVLDYDLFYGQDRAVTGVYKRHSLARAIGAIWNEAPKATRFALISDDSPEGLTRIADLKLYEAGLPKDHALLVQPPVTSWESLREVLRGLAGKADGAVICAMGQDKASLTLRRDPCPADILRGVDIPVVVLGPTRMDNRGALVLSIKPSAQVAPALERVERILQGESARSMLMDVPDDMAAYRSEPDL